MRSQVVWGTMVSGWNERGVVFPPAGGPGLREVIVDGPSKGTLAMVLGFALMAVGGLMGLLTGNDAVLGFSVLGGLLAIMAGATIYSGDS